MREDNDLQELVAQVEGEDRNEPHDALVRQVLRLRALDAFEYCLHPTTGQFEIDHIIPETLWPNYIAGRLEATLQPIPGRRGPHHLDNFAWSCPFCNLGKRQRVTQRVSRATVRLFDPRRDAWTMHFRFLNSYLFIAGTTPIGVATQRALGFNAGDIGGRLGTRHDSIVAGRCPPRWAALP